MPNIFREMTPCNDCPCCNTDYEEGSSCNLGYDTDLFWMEDGELTYASDNCELELLKYGGKEFAKPATVMARKERTDGC